MKLYEKWYSIEPIEGYVINADFARMKVLLEMELHHNVNFIKKRDFILLIITSKKPICKSLYHIGNILDNGRYKKPYEINYLGNERIIGKNLGLNLNVKRTIGIPY